MQNLQVNEIFYSLQGEGSRTGVPSIFIRLAKCNMACSFCDTEFESYNEMGFDEILKEVSKYNCKNIIWTGGEPTLQLTNEIVKKFKDNGYFQSIETNGSSKVPNGIDFICVSPKVAEHVIFKNFTHVNELKYVIRKGKPIPVPKVKSDFIYISPMSNGDMIDFENLEYCIELCRLNPQFRLTIQNHKIWKVR